MMKMVKSQIREKIPTERKYSRATYLTNDYYLNYIKRTPKTQPYKINNPIRKCQKIYMSVCYEDIQMAK